MFTLNQLTIEKSKLLPYALAIGATAIVVYQSTKPPAVVEKVRIKTVFKTVDRVVFKDRVKVVTEVITKPDGTKIDRTVTDETKYNSNTKEVSKKVQEDSVILTKLSSYSLSIHCDVRNCTSYENYQIIGGFRLGQLPLSLEVGGGVKGALIGIRLDF